MVSEKFRWPVFVWGDGTGEREESELSSSLCARPPSILQRPVREIVEKE